MLIIIASCNKKPVINPTTEDKFRIGKWTIESGTVSMRLPDGRDTVIDYMKFLPICRQDDYYVFHGGNDGAIFSNSNKCDPSDADSITFKWYLGDNNKSLSLYSGYQFFYGIWYQIHSWQVDTFSAPGDPLVLDTLHGYNDTLPGFTRVIPVLDTLWRLHFDSCGLKYNDHYNSTLAQFDQTHFKINFWVVGTYPDSTGHHTGLFIYPDPISGLPDSLDKDPIIRPDTLHYSIIFKNY
jgi:hypothetical protein